MKPVTINHGKCFNFANWYTFHCPKCEHQITRQETENQGCKKCGCSILWPKAEQEKKGDINA